jgi:NADPH2:quinone reductase
MKSVLCRSYGPPETLVYEDVPSPSPGPGEVVVTMKAASLNFPDILIIQGKYQVKPELPFAPGSEMAGIVKAAGDGVTRFAPGDHVMAFTTWGAFAEEVRTEAWRLLPIPDGMDFTTAAAFVLAYGTSDHALSDRAALAEGETLLVLGAGGGVGLAAIEIGKVLGARVIACASTDEKLAVCREHGADEAFNYTTGDLRDAVRRITAGRGADVVYDAVGGPYTEPALRSLAWRGRLLVVGFAAGDIPRIPLNLPLLKGCSIVGVFWGDFARREPERFAARVRQLGEWYRAGRLRPHVSKVLPLARAAEALGLLAARRVTGKIVLTT